MGRSRNVGVAGAAETVSGPEIPSSPEHALAWTGAHLAHGVARAAALTVPR